MNSTDISVYGDKLTVRFDLHALPNMQYKLKIVDIILEGSSIMDSIDDLTLHIVKERVRDHTLAMDAVEISRGVSHIQRYMQ